MQGSGINRSKDTRHLNVVSYSEVIYNSIRNAKVTEMGTEIPMRYHNLVDSLNEMKEVFKACHAKGNKVIFIGNGGSSAIASHMAIDYSKNGGIRAVSFNDFPTLTCLSNDFGYHQVFSKQMEYYCQKDDCVVCISTGGKSYNIRNAAAKARNDIGSRVYTFTGMDSDNPLRGMGYRNFFVDSYDYGVVEIAHLTLLHSICNKSFSEEILLSAAADPVL